MIEEMRNKKAELENELQALYDQTCEADPSIIYDYNRFSAIGVDLKKEINDLDRKIRLNEVPEWMGSPGDGALMSIAEFTDSVNSGCFIDSDGFGHYVLDNRESGIYIYPSDVKHNSVRSDFNQVIWYNR